MPRRKRAQQMSLLDFIDACSTGAQPADDGSFGGRGAGTDASAASHTYGAVTSDVGKPVSPAPEGAVVERTIAERLAGTMEQIRRDMATLAGPAEYLGSDRAWYEWRLAAYREQARSLHQQLHG